MGQKKTKHKGQGESIGAPLDELQGLQTPDGDLTPEERDRWLGAVELLREGETLIRADRAALRVYAQLRAQFDRVHRELATGPLTFATKNGYEQPSPLISIESDLRKQLVRTMVELGLTPKSRKLLVGSAKSQDKGKGWRELLDEDREER